MSQNERLARSIIRSNTNSTQRHSLLWLQDIEKATVGALDAKDEKLEKAHAAIRNADGCFGAALFEGWEQALADGNLDRIRDLWQRRLSFARDLFVGIFDREDTAADEEAKGNLVFRDETGKPTAILDTSNL